MLHSHYPVLSCFQGMNIFFPVILTFTTRVLIAMISTLFSNIPRRTSRPSLNSGAMDVEIDMICGAMLDSFRLVRCHVLKCQADSHHFPLRRAFFLGACEVPSKFEHIGGPQPVNLVRAANLQWDRPQFDSLGDPHSTPW